MHYCRLACKITWNIRATPSSKSLICFFHVGGEFVTNVEGEVKYSGGNVRVKSIKEGMMVKELRVMIGVWFGIDGYRCDIKYTLNFDEKILVDLIDDSEMENLFHYNDSSAHVYVALKESDNEGRAIDDTERQVTIYLAKVVIFNSVLVIC